MSVSVWVCTNLALGSSRAVLVVLSEERRTNCL